SLGPAWRARYSSTRALPSRPRACAYVRRKLFTNVGPGSRPHSSFSSARRYLALILVFASISETSMRARMRASRRVSPISGICRTRLVASGRRGLAQRRQNAWQVGLRDQHLPGLGALVAGDHAAPLEHVDHSPGARVAEAQAALEHRGGRRLHFGDQHDRIAQQRVLVGIELVARSLGNLGLDLLEQLFVQLGLALLAPQLG